MAMVWTIAIHFYHKERKEDGKEEKQSDGDGEAHGLGTCTSKLVLKCLPLPPNRR